MLEKANVTFYRVQRCGCYKHGSGTPEFGSMADLLRQLSKWSDGKELSQTRLTQPSGDGDSLPVYLFGIEEKAGNALVSMWNEVPATKDGKVASVPANAKVGKAQQVLNKVQKGTIPGFPTFFWFVPEVGVLATLRFDQLVTGQKPLQEYCEQFLATSSSYAVQLPPDKENELESITVYGYRRSDKEPPSTNVHPLFRTVLFIKPGQHELIIKRTHDIRKVHRRASLSLKNQEQRSYWQKGLALVGVGRPNAQPSSAKMRASISAQPSSEEVKTIIKDWKAHGSSQWDDYGFQFKGEQKVHWLSSASARGEFTINVERDNVGQIDRVKLLDAVMHIKPELLTLLK